METESRTVRCCANCNKKINIGEKYCSGRGLPATLCPSCYAKAKAEKK